MSEHLDVVVQVDGSDLDDAERVDLARHLRRELDNVAGVRAEPATAGRAPSGAKAGEALTAGALVVSLAPLVFAQLAQILTHWLDRQRVGIKVVIDDQSLDGTVTPEQRDALVEAFLTRAAKRPE